MKEIQKAINLPNGHRLVLMDRVGKAASYTKEECNRNIYLLDSTDKIVWQVYTDFDENGGSFTNIFVDSDEFKAYRWDGGTYKLDLGSGEGTPLQLMK